MSEEIIDLSQFDDDFEAAPEPSLDTNKVPEGRYTATITRVYFRNAKTSHRPMLSWELVITGPDQIGRHLFRNNMLDKLEWVKKDLRTCGVTVTRLSDLDLESLLDLELEVQVKNNGDNQNVYLNKLIGSVEPGARTDSASTTASKRGSGKGVTPF